MEAEAARFLGAGIAALSLVGAGIGVGILFGNFLAGALRNPSAMAQARGLLFVGAALSEATGLFGFALAIIILGA